MENRSFDEVDFGSDLSDEALVEIIRKESEDQLPALKELFKRDTPLSMRIAEEVIQNEKYHRRMKRTAVTYMESAGGPAQAKLMLKELKKADPQAALAREMVTAIGKIGGKDSFRALREMKRLPDNQSIALALLSYRNGLNEHYVNVREIQEAELGPETEKVKVRKISEKRSEEMQQQFSHGTELKRFSLYPLAELQCSGNRFVINVSETFRQSSYEKLREQQAIPFQVLKLEECPQMLTLVYYVLTHPTKQPDTMAVTLLDTLGRRHYIGHMKLENKGLTFSIGAIADGLAAPAQFRGRILENRTIEFEEARIGKRIADGKPKMPSRAK